MLQTIHSTNKDDTEQHQQVLESEAPTLSTEAMEAELEKRKRLNVFPSMFFTLLLNHL